MADEEQNKEIETPAAEEEKNEETTQPEAEEEKDTENPDNTEDDKQPEEDKEKEEEPKKPEEDVDLEDTKQVTDALNKKGIDYNALAEEYMKNGNLSDKSMEALKAVGIPQEMVQDYIKGCEARAELERNELAECVGGKEAMEEIIDWAAHNLKKEEIIAINEIRNKFELQAVLKGLKADMEKQEGKTPDYQKGSGDKPTINGFRSQAEMFAAIKDERYKKDEAYRADIQKKIAASREAGIDLGIY